MCENTCGTKKCPFYGMFGWEARKERKCDWLNESDTVMMVSHPSGDSVFLTFSKPPPETVGFCELATNRPHGSEDLWTPRSRHKTLQLQQPCWTSPLGFLCHHRRYHHTLSLHGEIPELYGDRHSGIQVLVLLQFHLQLPATRVRSHNLPAKPFQNALPSDTMRKKTS